MRNPSRPPPPYSRITPTSRPKTEGGAARPFSPPSSRHGRRGDAPGGCSPADFYPPTTPLQTTHYTLGLSTSPHGDGEPCGKEKRLRRAGTVGDSAGNGFQANPLDRPACRWDKLLTQTERSASGNRPSPSSPITIMLFACYCSTVTSLRPCHDATLSENVYAD